MPAPPSAATKAANDRAIAAAKASAASRSSAPNAAAATASARLNSGNAGRATPSGVGNQMGNGRSMTTTRPTTNTNTRSAPMGFSAAQFGRQQYSPGQMYSDPNRAGAALRSVVNGINLMGGTPQQKTDAMLRNMGYSNPNARAGMIGNFAHESMNFSPSVLNGKIMGDNGTAFGLAQWRGDRLDNLKNFLSSSGLPTNSLAGQVAFAGTELPNSYKKSYDRTMAATTPAEATAAMLGFERPAGYKTFAKTGNPTGVAGWADRLASANQAFGLNPPAASSMMASAQPVARPAPTPASIAAPAATPTPAAAPPVQMASTPSIWEQAASYAKQKGQDALATYQQASAAVNNLPGSPEQKAAAIKGYAENGVFGGALGYLTGGGIKGSAPSNDSGSARNQAERVRTDPAIQAAQNNPDFKALSSDDKRSVMDYVKQGYSVAEAIAKVKGTGTTTTPPTPVPAWTPPTFITRPYTRVV